MGKGCSSRTNMIPLDYTRYEDMDLGYQMVTEMIGEHEDLGEVDQDGWRLALMRWDSRHLERISNSPVRSHKERYLIVHHDPEWNDWQALDKTFKEACKMTRARQQEIKDDREWERWRAEHPKK